MIGEHPGYVGAFTRDEATGAIPNGTRITKVYSEEGDTHPVGTAGVILGSLAADAAVAEQYGTRYFYFVEWDPLPGVAIGVSGLKIGVFHNG